ncbi:hypothetical protein PTNB29_08546 [Pyrenophora teres f. teres]|nr:hypothetical protein PTNB29_08546 [Pyrenophora teres f. teres]
MSSSAIGKRKAPVDYSLYFIHDNNANDNNTNDNNTNDNNTNDNNTNDNNTNDNNTNDNNTNDKSFKPDTTTHRRRRQQSTPTSVRYPLTPHINPTPTYIPTQTTTTSTSTSTSDKITDKETTTITTTIPRKNKSSATTIEPQVDPILWWGYNVVKGEKQRNWYRAIKHPNGAVEKKPVREAEVPIERLLLEDWNALSEREKKRKYSNDFDNYVAVVRS